MLCRLCYEEAIMYFMSVNKIKLDADRALLNKTIPVHREWAKKLLAAGTLVQAGKWGDRGGMIVVKADSIAEAEKVVDQDPLAQAGLITFETDVLHPAVAFG
jgi:uncharacterized protein YciI